MNLSVPLGRNALMVAGLIAVVLAVYWPSATALWAYWGDPDNGAGAPAGHLIALLSLWMLFRTRHALASVPVRPVRWAYPVLVACSVGSLIFWRAGIQSLQLLLLPPLIFFGVFAALGPRVTRIVAFPIGYLYFAMPGWGFLAPPLQEVTVRVVSVLAPLVGLPVRVAGNVFHLPGGGAFEITIFCSGVNFLVAGLAVAALLGELEHASLRRRTWLVVIMGIVAIVSNWVRALLIIGIGYATHMRSVFATEDHLFFGWIIFAGVLLTFVWLAPRDPASEAHGRPTPLGKVPESRSLAGYVTAAALLTAVPVWVYGATMVQSAPFSQVQIPFPVGPAEWRGPLAVADALWQPVFVGPHSEWHFVYDGPSARSVEVMAIGYPRQEQGRELVNEGNSLLGKHGLTALAGGLAVDDGHPYRELIAVDDQGHRSLIWSVYDIGGRTFVTPFYSQVWYGIRSFTGTPYSALFAFRAACEASCDEARATLRDFVQAIGTDLFASVTHESRSDPIRGPA